jgi:two-component system sensor histidine kinase QseC
LPSELRPVARRLDDLLRRLEAAFAREKSFTADVAHELRTPLSGLRTTLEVMLSKPREAGQYREALDECLVIGRRLQALVDNLLSLAQLEGQRAALATEPVQIDYLMRETWKLFAERAAARHVKIEWRIPAPVFVDSDAVRLRIVVANLFDNAVSYVDEGGTITIAASSSAGRAELSVANTGSMVGGEDVTRIFDRFWRGDRSRAVGLHCGLGLALCQRIAVLVGGTIVAEAEKGKVFCITVTMPAGDVPIGDDETSASGS